MRISYSHSTTKKGKKVTAMTQLDCGHRVTAWCYYRVTAQGELAVKGLLMDEVRGHEYDCKRKKK
jgi:hypothetical protein